MVPSRSATKHRAGGCNQYESASSRGVSASNTYVSPDATTAWKMSQIASLSESDARRMFSMIARASEAGGASLSFDHRRSPLRRDEDRRVGYRYHLVLFAGAGEQVVAGAQLDAADADGSGENDDFLGSFVGMARKARASAQSHDRRAAARIVVPEQAAIDSRIVGGLPLAVGRLVDQHRRLLKDGILLRRSPVVRNGPLCATGRKQRRPSHAPALALLRR